MNRADQRRLKRVAAKAVKRAIAGSTRRLGTPPPESIVLQGGPMDGWVVKPDAPALQPEWCLDWPEWMAKKHDPGFYVLDVATKRARWERL